MMSFLKIIEQMRDPYERKARITPGLLTSLPILLPILCTYGPKHPILTSVITLLAGCGAIFALGNIARGRGKKLEEMLVVEWGGLPTTIILRHRDDFLDTYTKQRYRELIKLKLDISMPTIAEELANPAQADDIYKGVSRRLRELNRNNKSLLLKENIAYGFHRNMVGMKPMGLFTSLIGIFYGLVATKIFSFEPFGVHFFRILDPGLAALITFTVSVALLSSWLFYFNKAAVKSIGYVYAERLFECLTKMPTPRRKPNKVEGITEFSTDL